MLDVEVNILNYSQNHVCADHTCNFQRKINTLILLRKLESKSGVVRLH